MNTNYNQSTMIWNAVQSYIQDHHHHQQSLKQNIKPLKNSERFVTYIPWSKHSIRDSRASRLFQLAQMNDCTRRFRIEARYIAMLDIDEWLLMNPWFRYKKNPKHGSISLNDESQLRSEWKKIVEKGIYNVKYGLDLMHKYVGHKRSTNVWVRRHSGIMCPDLSDNQKKNNNNNKKDSLIDRVSDMVTIRNISGIVVNSTGKMFDVLRLEHSDQNCQWKESQRINEITVKDKGNMMKSWMNKLNPSTNQYCDSWPNRNFKIKEEEPSSSPSTSSSSIQSDSHVESINFDCNRTHKYQSYLRRHECLVTWDPFAKEIVNPSNVHDMFVHRTSMFETGSNSWYFGTEEKKWKMRVWVKKSWHDSLMELRNDPFVIVHTSDHMFNNEDLLGVWAKQMPGLAKRMDRKKHPLFADVPRLKARIIKERIVNYAVKMGFVSDRIDRLEKHWRKMQQRGDETDLRDIIDDSGRYCQDVVIVA